MSYKVLALCVIFLPRIGGSILVIKSLMLSAEPTVLFLSRSVIVLVYKIFGLTSGPADGLIFNSCVSNLQSQPELWLDECPYLYARPSSREIDALRVELVSTHDDPCPLLSLNRSAFREAQFAQVSG